MSVRVESLRSRPRIGRSRQACRARRACAVKSAPLRSNGSLPQPRQNVGQPPSAFCRLSSQPQPGEPPLRRRARSSWRIDGRATIPPGVQRQQRPGRIVGVGYRAAQVAPAPAARRGAGVGMLACGCWQSSSQSRIPSFDNVLAAGGQGVDGQRRVPGGQVGVDRPTAVVAEGVADEPQTRPGSPEWSDATDRGQAHDDKTGQRHRLQVTRRWPAASAAARVRAAADRGRSPPAQRAEIAEGDGNAWPGRWPPARGSRS